MAERRDGCVPQLKNLLASRGREPPVSHEHRGTVFCRLRSRGARDPSRDRKGAGTSAIDRLAPRLAVGRRGLHQYLSDTTDRAQQFRNCGMLPHRRIPLRVCSLARIVRATINAYSCFGRHCATIGTARRTPAPPIPHPDSAISHRSADRFVNL